MKKTSKYLFYSTQAEKVLAECPCIFYLVMHFIFCVTIEVWQKVRKVVIDSAVKASGVVYIKHTHVVQYTHITIINS